MSLWIDTTYRSKGVELMDDLEMDGELLRDTLDKIAVINRRLGGNEITLDGIKKLLQSADDQQTITIIDLGCGNGDMLRAIANYGTRTGKLFDLIGVDANQFTVMYAEELSANYENINYKKLDVFSKDFEALEYDIALGTLFIHHFKEKEIKKLLSKVYEKAKIGIVINDLQRHKLAYFLFKIGSFFFGNEMVRYDGLLSILRGFKKKELEKLNRQLNFKSIIRWRWAFRYQWIIQK